MSVAGRIALGAAAAALVGASALSLWYGGAAALSDANTLQARWLVGEWRDGKGPAFTPALWLQARDTLRHALQTTPGNPQLHDDLGFLHASRAQAMGTMEGGSAAQHYQNQLLDEAIASYRTSTTLRPTFPYSWAYLALAKQLRGQIDDELWLAFDRALQYGHAEPGVQRALAQVAFAHWPTLSQARQAGIANMVDTAQAQIKTNLEAMAAQQQIVLQ